MKKVYILGLFLVLYIFLFLCSILTDVLIDGSYPIDKFYHDWWAIFIRAIGIFIILYFFKIIKFKENPRI